MKSLLIAGGTGFFGTTFIDAFERGWLARWGIKDLIIASRNASKFTRFRRSQNIVYLDLDLTEICVFPECDYIYTLQAQARLGVPQKSKARSLQS